jgi:hypothetical protein
MVSEVSDDEMDMVRLRLRFCHSECKSRHSQNSTRISFSQNGWNGMFNLSNFGSCWVGTIPLPGDEYAHHSVL